MSTAIIIHGTCDEDEYFSDEYPSLSNSHWLPWLQKQLLMKNILTQTPEMPEAYRPDYEQWKGGFERFSVDEDTTLIGHSCGGGFLLRWLSEHPVRLKRLVLVAPWLDPKQEKTTTFFDFRIDPGLQARVGELHLFVSTDDEVGILESVETIRHALPGLTYHEFQHAGHFCYSDLRTDHFPELLVVAGEL